LAARSGKPLILSTGAANEDEIDWAVKTYCSFGGKELTLLQCTARYPAANASMNLLTIPWLMKRFGVEAGLSDHSRDPLCAPLAAAALGATIIEKHFTLNNSLPGPDHAFAVTPLELKGMVQAVRVVEEMRGSEVKVIDPCEEELRAYARRGIQAIREILPGEVFKEDFNIAILRPGNKRICRFEIKRRKACRHEINLLPFTKISQFFNHFVWHRKIGKKPLEYLLLYQLQPDNHFFQH